MLFADDIVLAWKSIDEINTDFDVVITALQDKGLKASITKTELNLFTFCERKVGNGRNGIVR